MNHHDLIPTDFFVMSYFIRMFSVCCPPVAFPTSQEIDHLSANLMANRTPIAVVIVFVFVLALRAQYRDENSYRKRRKGQAARRRRPSSISHIDICAACLRTQFANKLRAGPRVVCVSPEPRPFRSPDKMHIH